MIDRNIIFSFLACLALTSSLSILFEKYYFFISLFIVICFTIYKGGKTLSRIRKTYFSSIGNLLYLDNINKITLSKEEKDFLLDNFDSYSFSGYVKVIAIESEYLKETTHIQG
tara:strand:+ start:102 stop:440 length:339 start_codon:yes stop_codon:yes gene_type:complete